MKKEKQKQNKSLPILFAVIILAIIIGLIVFFANKPSTQSDNSSTSTTNNPVEDAAFENAIKDVDEVKLSELNGDKAVEIAEEYITAVNSEDWANIEKYSKGMTKTIRKYQLSNMEIVINSKGEKYKYDEAKNEYIFIVEFSFGTQNEEDIQAIANGQYFIVKLVDGVVKVNPIASEL